MMYFCSVDAIPLCTYDVTIIWHSFVVFCYSAVCIRCDHNVMFVCSIDANNGKYI